MPYAVLDRNNLPVSFDTNAVGSNVAATVVIADENGNKFPLAPGAVALPVQSEGVKPGYIYAALGFAPVATPTDCFEIQGSATKTVRIRRIELGGVATAAANMPVSLIRRSSADTTALVRTAIVAFKPDTAYAAATAVVSSIGTANPGSLGGAVGGSGPVGRIQLSAAATGVAAERLIFNFDVNACVLRGASEFLYINFGGTALPAGAVFDISVYIQEDGS